MWQIRYCLLCCVIFSHSCYFSHCSSHHYFSTFKNMYYLLTWCNWSQPDLFGLWLFMLSPNWASLTIGSDGTQCTYKFILYDCSREAYGVCASQGRAVIRYTNMNWHFLWQLLLASITYSSHYLCLFHSPIYNIFFSPSPIPVSTCAYFTHLYITYSSVFTYI